MNATPTTSPDRRRTSFGRRLLMLILFPAALVMATPAVASAETDNSGTVCINNPANGRLAACGSFSITWGSGQNWSVTSTASDRQIDRRHTTTEIRLDRKFMSDTGWIHVATSGDSLVSSTRSTSGWDPTSGAWIRLCSWPITGGNGSCWTTYVSDNS